MSELQNTVCPKCMLAYLHGEQEGCPRCERDALRASLAEAQGEVAKRDEVLSKAYLLANMAQESNDALRAEVERLTGERDEARDRANHSLPFVTTGVEATSKGASQFINWQDAEARKQAAIRIAEAAESARDAALARATVAEDRALEAEAKSKIDEAQCDEMTDQAGKLAERLTAVESRAEKAEADLCIASNDAAKIIARCDAALADARALRVALIEAASSLETLSRAGLSSAGEFLSCLMQVRGYANSRASVARASLAAGPVEEKEGK